MTEQPGTPIPSDAARERASYWFTRRDEMAQERAIREQFEQWRDADPQHAAAYEALERLWNASAFEQALQGLEVDLGIPPAPTRHFRRRTGTRLLAWAAVLLLMLGAGWMTDVPMRLQAEHLTSIAQVEHLELADGSRIVLGSNSAISSEFTPDQRHIRLLRGELYVEAAHDEARPLTIEAGESRVRVVGTKFSVSKRDDRVTVAVREGRVRFADSAGASDLLQAGNWQQLRNKQLQPLNPEGGERQMAWVNGRLSFQDTPLVEVLGELRRYYPAPILLFNDSAAQDRVSGNYRLDDPLAIVQALGQVTGTRLTRLPGGILLIR